jgi:hypothetical protein
MAYSLDIVPKGIEDELSRYNHQHTLLEARGITYGAIVSRVILLPDTWFAIIFPTRAHSRFIELFDSLSICHVC